MQVYCRVSSAHVCGMLEPDPEVWWCTAAVELESGVFVGVIASSGSSLAHLPLSCAFCHYAVSI